MGQGIGKRLLKMTGRLLAVFIKIQRPGILESPTLRRSRSPVGLFSTENIKKDGPLALNKPRGLRGSTGNNGPLQDYTETL